MMLDTPQHDLCNFFSPVPTNPLHLFSHPRQPEEAPLYKDSPSHPIPSPVFKPNTQVSNQHAVTLHDGS